MRSRSCCKCIFFNRSFVIHILLSNRFSSIVPDRNSKEFIKDIFNLTACLPQVRCNYICSVFIPYELMCIEMFEWTNKCLFKDLYVFHCGRIMTNIVIHLSISSINIFSINSSSTTSNIWFHLVWDKYYLKKSFILFPRFPSPIYLHKKSTLSSSISYRFRYIHTYVYITTSIEKEKTRKRTHYNNNNSSSINRKIESFIWDKGKWRICVYVWVRKKERCIEMGII